MPLPAGTRLGPYEITGSLGSRGLGQVYRARDSRLDRTAAIKVPPARLAADPIFRERFEREARSLSALSHPRICTVHDIGRHDGIDCLVMEQFAASRDGQQCSSGRSPAGVRRRSSPSSTGGD
jgi:serine/threonine protein kinase